MSVCSLSLPRPGMALPMPLPAALWPIAATVLAFILWWPLGLAALALWKLGFAFGLAPAWAGQRHRRPMAPLGFVHSSSGNSAFDAHRAATLQRLEEERRALDRQQAEFAAFLDQLKQAKDREEFDRFMASRGARPAGA